jgi:hypothetical protein
MAGLRIVWINDGITSTIGALAKPAYRLLGKWAFNLTSEWTGFISATDAARMNYLAGILKQAFYGITPIPNGATNLSPRVLILYDSTGPATPLSDANIQTYHLAHQIRIQQDGDTYTTLVFKGDPLHTDFESYWGDYGTDENEGSINIGRARKMFAMSLMTRCR